MCRCAYIQPVGSTATQPAPREICVITGCGGHSYSQTTNGADGVEVGPWPAFGRVGFPTALPRTGLATFAASGSPCRPGRFAGASAPDGKRGTGRSFDPDTLRCTRLIPLLKACDGALLRWDSCTGHSGPLGSTARTFQLLQLFMSPMHMFVSSAKGGAGGISRRVGAPNGLQECWTICRRLDTRK